MGWDGETRGATLKWAAESMLHRNRSHGVRECNLRWSEKCTMCQKKYEGGRGGGGRFKCRTAATPLFVVALHGAAEDHLEQLRNGGAIPAGDCRRVDRCGTAAVLLQCVAIVVLELLDELLDIVGLRKFEPLRRIALRCCVHSVHNNGSK